MKIKSYNEKFNIGEKIAVYPGSFDPYHHGHEVLIDRFLPLFDKIIIMIGINEQKKGHYSIEERKEIIEKIYKGNPKIIVDSYKGWTVDFCVENGAKYLLRGMRDTKDFEFEKYVDHYNKNLNPNIETIYMIAGKETENISSTEIRKGL
jgi:pantetheine-phosphate adenylyltransferase